MEEKEEKNAKPPKFKLAILIKSIAREAYRRATEAAKITDLNPKRTAELMDRIGDWAMELTHGKFMARVAKSARRRVRRLVLGDGK